MDQQEWLSERRRGIGSSDAAACCGLSRWATPLSVYLDKLGELERRPMTPEMMWGLRLEPVIADAYCELRPGVELTMPGFRRHTELPWMVASADRVANDGRIVELKTCNYFASDEWGEPGTDQVPEAYLLQVMHQMAVHRSHGEPIESADVAVLIGGTDFRIYSVPWVELLASRLIEIEAELWMRIERRRPPPADWQHPSTPALIAAMYSPDGGVEMLDAEAQELARDYTRLGAAEAEAAERRTVIKARLIERMGNASLGLCPDGTKIMRKQVNRRAYEVKATSYCTFSVKLSENGEGNRE
jgi:putative phage-type endonuclease